MSRRQRPGPVATPVPGDGSPAGRSATASRARRPLEALSWLLFALLFSLSAGAAEEDGYELWLRYRPIEAQRGPAPGAMLPSGLVVLAPDSPTVRVARDELRRGLRGLLGRAPAALAAPRAGALVLARAGDVPAGSPVRDTLATLGSEGYLVRHTRLHGVPVTLIAANTDIGLLYGSFAYLRELGVRGRAALARLDLRDAPRVRHRVLDHWDNLDRSVERGYAGESIWNWFLLPNIVDRRTIDYARASASIGINGATLNNVNSNAEVLTAAYIAKAAAIADVLRPYGVRVHLAIRWSTPLELKETRSADPLDPAVIDWWKHKADEIYRAIPDFGGFLVKANAEGQPGPHDYGRSHAEGANMLARALAPHGGIVRWRAFVYADGQPGDRAAQAHDQFKPLDGRFDANVLVQVKNGPIDFQPREPVHPLFGAMPATPLALEFQITKEYLGFSTHLVYLGTLFEEVLQTDTMAREGDARVARVIDGSLHGHLLSGMSGVANVGSERNWCGSHFDQANWYAFGRLAWNPYAGARGIAREWAAQTFSRRPEVVEAVSDMMMASHQAAVDYMTPLGLHHLMGTGHHHGPAPWVDELPIREWNPTYYHRADAAGLGFDRTASGTHSVSRYAAPLAERYADRRRVPEKFLLWFHRVGWNERLRSGRSLWHELIAHYDRGVGAAQALQARWEALRPHVDPRRHEETAQRLAQQLREALWWRDACIAYFQSVSGLPLPPGARTPAHPLAYYKELRFSFIR